LLLENLGCHRELYNLIFYRLIKVTDSSIFYKSNWCSSVFAN